MCALCDNKDKWFDDGEFCEYDSGILTNDNILKLYNQGGYDFVEFNCKFCPVCGKKLDNLGAKHEETYKRRSQVPNDG